MISTKNAFAAPLLAFVLLLVLAAAAQASTIIVNVHDDPGTPGDCQTTDSSCSLRQAIATAQPGDVLDLQGSAASPVTYSLTQPSDIVIAQNITVQGNGVDATTIDGSGNGLTRIFRVNSGSVLIQGLSITHGVDGNDEAFQSCSPCLTINANGGGALFNDGGTVTLDNVAFTDNGDDTPLGGAISNRFGSLTLTDVSFTGNNAAAGGGLFVGGGTVNGVGVTFENNGTGAFDGGAAYVQHGTLALTNTTIVGNGWGSSFGGGVANGGGIVTLVHDTFSGNIRGAIQTDQGAETHVGSTIIGAGFADGTDFACLPSGRWTDDFNDLPVGQAITNDDGNNLDEDGHCGFDGNGDIVNADPKLASIADNGGPTRTQALLFGSPAIGNANELECPATDQRDITRDGLCDIGAFNTRPTSVPATPSTSEAGNITDSSADLHGTINLSGDAGGFHFVWGLSQEDLLNSTAVQGAGVISSDTPVTQTLSFLNPGTKYFYKIVADNASGSTADTAADIQSFTTLADAPSVFNVNAGSVTDTTADLSFTINPNGADTSYVIQYGDGDPADDQTTDPIDIGADAGDQPLTATLHGLDPNSNYHFEVIATNSVDSTNQSGENFTTDQQIGGTARIPIVLNDGGQSNFGCPQTDARIDWGDGTTIDHVTPDCVFPGDEEDAAVYSLTAGHTYADPGNYEIEITYPDIELTSTQFAQISENDVVPPSNTTRPAISGTPSAGNPLTCSDGSWSNDPTGFAFAWNRDGNPISAATGHSYTIQTADVGHTLTCTVIASNAGGSSSPATSPGVAVQAGTGPHGGGGSGSGGDSGSGGSGSKPTPNMAKTSTPNPTSAAFDGSVNPGGLATTAHFEYGLDSKYSNPGTSGPVYTQSTPAQNIGSDSTNHTVSASVSGLVPNALYHVRLVATNSAGTTFGPDTTFTTAAAPTPGAPAVTKSFNAKPTQGLVLIEVNGKLVPLTQLKQIPSGAVIDALHGTLNLVTSTGAGHKTQTGTFAGAIFKVTQDHSGLTTLTIVENAFKGAPSYASCKVPAGKASAAKLSAKTLQLLRGKDNHGKFRTKGRYAAATTRGTAWTIADRCDGTLTHVTQDSVLINDLVLHKTFTLRAGHSYLALAKPPRHK